MPPASWSPARPRTRPSASAERAAAGRPDRLGDVLVEQGVITPDQLAEALARHRHIGEPLGSVLLARGLITRRQLFVALARVWDADLTFVDSVDVDEELARLFPSAQLAREMWVPLRVERDGDGEPRVVVATAGRPSVHIARAVLDRTGIPAVRQVVTTDWDVQRALRTVWRDELVHDAVRSLAERRPDESASTVFVRAQVVLGLTLLIGTIVCAALWFSTTMLVLVAALNVTVALAVGAKALISTVGTAYETVEQVTDAEVAALADADLPLYTILVPVYREAGIVGLLMRNLAALDYPREKLEILLLLEEDDPETLAAALASAPPSLVRIVVVPHSLPKTKPRACNVGLTFARGEFVVIYDAEDRPEHDQLKKSVIAFREGGDDLVCVQAALNYFNARENLLTRMFTLEYSSWFDYTLAGLDKLRLPIPLGGTSNHFRTDMLRDLGGWDPYNVTEDADLGIRASARGHRVAVINSTTYEEANMAVGNWIRQRSRWIKGYMQTGLVHTRHPLHLVHTLGLRQAAGFALLIGGTPLMFLAIPWLYAIFLAELVWPGDLSSALPRWVVLVSTANLLFGNGVIVYLSLLAGFKRRNYGLVGFALLSPFYWLLHSIASYKALWQLLVRPFYWEKTTHGLTSHAPAGSHSPLPAGAHHAAVDSAALTAVVGREPAIPTARTHGSAELRRIAPTTAAGSRTTAVLREMTSTTADAVPSSLADTPSMTWMEPPAQIPMVKVARGCAMVVVAEAAVTITAFDSLQGAFYAACFTIMAVFAVAYCLTAVTTAGFAAGAGAAGLVVLEPTWLLTLLVGAALVAVACGLAPGWTRVEAWQAQRSASALPVMGVKRAGHWILRCGGLTRWCAGRRGLENWRSDRVWAAFLVLVYPPLATSCAVWVMWWLAHR